MKYIYAWCYISSLNLIKYWNEVSQCKIIIGRSTQRVNVVRLLNIILVLLKYISALNNVIKSVYIAISSLNCVKAYNIKYHNNV